MTSTRAASTSALAGRIFDVCVVGGGVVGTAVCRELTHRGLDVVLVEKGHIGGGVSAGNTGIACTLLDIPQGTVERRCLERGLPLNVPTYKALGIPHNSSGTLYVAWSEEELVELASLSERALVAAGSSRGVISSAPQLLSSGTLREEEPGLGPGALGALLVPGETVVEPGLVPLAFCSDALRCGATLLEDSAVVALRRRPEIDGWAIQVCVGSRRDGLVSTEPEVAGLSERELLAGHVVNCGGLDADEVADCFARDGLATSTSQLEFRPRRGDYVVLRAPNRGASLPLRRPIGSVPMPHARGVYVWPTVHGDIACGPTNVVQNGKELPETQQDVIEALVDRAYQVVPALRDWLVVGCYAGLRPSLEPAAWGTDYIIRSGPDRSGDGSGRAGVSGWTVVTNVRSTGLSASLGIAGVVADDIVPECVRRRSGVCADGGNAHDRPANHPNPLPQLSALARDFNAHGDGTIQIGSRRFRVGHALTRIGLTDRVGITANGTASSCDGHRPKRQHGSALWLSPAMTGATRKYSSLPLAQSSSSTGWFVGQPRRARLPSQLPSRSAFFSTFAITNGAARVMRRL